MSSYTLKRIIEDVKVTIDEVQKNDSEFDSEVDNQDMNTIIKSKIADALRFVYANADWSVLEPDATSSTTDTGYSIEGNVGKYILPSTFLRLVYAKFDSWKRYLGHTDLIMWDNPEYATLSDTYATGTPDRPKIALGWSSGGKCLELYSRGGKKEPVDFFAGKSYYQIGQGVFVRDTTPGTIDTRTLVKQGNGWFVYYSFIDSESTDKICAVYHNGSIYTLSKFNPATFQMSDLVSTGNDSFVIGYMNEPKMSVIDSTKTGDEKDGYIIPDKCYRAVIYYISALTMVTYRDNGSAQLFFQEASDLIGFTQLQAQRQAIQAQQTTE